MYDGDNIALEYDGSNTLIAAYVSAIGEDSQMEMVRGGQTYYYQRDGQNSVVAVTDSSGVVVQAYRYDAFGLQSAAGSITNPFTYTGREYDPKSGLYFLRARYYDPRAGRFISEDPVGVPNRYPYADNDPSTGSIRLDSKPSSSASRWKRGRPSARTSALSPP
ncbi:MAG TPA: RHS repeat-associated core domain-containing protein [bacterium]|nr:RHS repeat-associated core domain-containing protein [bacterium]